MLQEVESRIPLPVSRLDMARRIDETKLVFSPSEDETATITALCQNALKEHFRSVCVRPRHVRLAKSLLEGSDVMVATVIGFPQNKALLTDEQTRPSFGGDTWEAKAQEMTTTRAQGADEFDVVMNVPRFKALHNGGRVSQSDFELLPLVEAATGVPIKLIIETDLLTPPEIETATRLAADAGIAMVKTSTGMLDGGRGATVENIRRIYNTIHQGVISHKPGIKASGGVRSAAQALDLIRGGTDVLGSSSGSALLDDFEALHPESRQLQ